MDNVHGIRVTGGSFPAEIWQKFMYDADRDYPEEDFAEPVIPISYDRFFKSSYAVAPTTSTISTTTTTIPTTDTTDTDLDPPMTDSTFRTTDTTFAPPSTSPPTSGSPPATSF